jgi:hypothetical protein
MEMTVSTVSRNGSVQHRGATAEKMIVTPEMASSWLQRNHNNRTVVVRRVKAYASQMAHGSWKLTHQGIAFDEHGNLVDGQHRLMAVVESGLPVLFWVFRGVTREAMIAIDIGKGRTATDAFSLLGDVASPKSVAIARILLGAYMHQKGISERLDIAYEIGWDRFRVFHSAMRDAIEFSHLEAREKGLRHGCVSAAIACAWFTQNRDLLSDFKDQFCSGVVTSESDVSAIRLRTFMMTTKKTRGGRDARADLFMRSCTAIRAYLERRPLQKLYAATDAVFAIPDIEGL